MIIVSDIRQILELLNSGSLPGKAGGLPIIIRVVRIDDYLVMYSILHEIRSLRIRVVEF